MRPILRDATAGDADIGAIGRHAGAVDDGAAADDDVVAVVAVRLTQLTLHTSTGMPLTAALPDGTSTRWPGASRLLLVPACSRATALPGAGPVVTPAVRQAHHAADDLVAHLGHRLDRAGLGGDPDRRRRRAMPSALASCGWTMQRAPAAALHEHVDVVHPRVVRAHVAPADEHEPVVRAARCGPAAAGGRRGCCRGRARRRPTPCAGSRRCAAPSGRSRPRADGRSPATRASARRGARRSRRPTARPGSSGRRCGRGRAAWSCP